MLKCPISIQACRICVSLVLCGVANAGILVTRLEKGLQFTEAFSVNVNGKDKVLALGTEPKINGPVGKLASIKIDRALLKDSSGVVALYDEEAIKFILPENLPKNSAPDPAKLWRSAKIAYKKTEKDKTLAEVPMESFVVFLPGGLEELTRLCLDSRGLAALGGKSKTFDTQLQWIAAVSKAFAVDPAAQPLKRYVERAMRDRYEQFETGTAGADVLQQSLQLADLSESLYAAAPEHAELRKAILGRKAWLDRKMAILLAFDAGEEWDAFLVGDSDFARYQQAFPEMAAKHTEALKKSLLLHTDAGDTRQKNG
ncbi:MAG TPA: hypothetical protein VGM62_11125, partial [Chthoniobacterales bacterium]